MSTLQLTNNKVLLEKAIENYNILSESQKRILKTLISFDYPVPSDVIMKLTSLSKQAFHFSMKKLLSQNFVTREKIRIFVYKENREKMLEILDIYNQQRFLEQKSYGE